MEAWEVLERAADKIDRDGWCQFALARMGDERTCAMGAIINVVVHSV